MKSLKTLLKKKLLTRQKLNELHLLHFANVRGNVAYSSTILYKEIVCFPTFTNSPAMGATTTTTPSPSPPPTTGYSPNSSLSSPSSSPSFSPAATASVVHAAAVRLMNMPAECRPKSLRALTNTVCKGLSTFALVDPTMPYIAAKLNEALIIVMKTKAETTAESSGAATSGGGGAGGGGAAAATVEAAPGVPHDVDTSKMDGEHGPYTWSQFRNYYYPNITLANKMWGKGIPVSVVAATANAGAVSSEGAATADEAATPASKLVLPASQRLLTTPDLQGVRDSGKAFQIIKALAIKRANGVFMRPTTASDVTLAWGRIAKYIASLAKKSSSQEAPPPPVAEVASRIWQLCLCRTTPEPQEVAAGLVSSGLARIVQTLPVPSALKILKGGSKGSSEASSKVQLECPLQRDDPSVVAVLCLIKSQIPTTLFDELPSEREVKAAAARDTATASSDGNGNAVWYTQPTRSSRRQARYWLGDVADEIENNVRLGTVDNIKVGTGARAKGVVGKMPFEKRKHQARCKDWEKKKESHARAHGGSRKKKCARTRGTIRC